MALTDYDKKNLSSSDQKKIQAATDKWNAANAKGDKEGMKNAAAEAEAVRKNAGYKTDDTGKYTGSYSPTSSGGGSSGGGNSQYTGSNKIYNPNTDYQTYINDAVAKGDFASAAMYEQLRNQKIMGEGLDYELTNLYGSYLDGYNQQKNQQDAFDMFNQYVQQWEQNNPKAEYESKYDPQIDELLSQILNRDDFSYDAMNDPLYQQYAEMYRREGDRAMRDTLAEAASGAGGMNTYAITAAQQANNYYNSQLNDKIPELYQLAYDMYLNDKESKVQDLGILQNMDATQYGRYRDTINDYYNDKSFAYGVYQDAVNQGNWQTNFDYGSTWDKINYNTDNYWKGIDNSWRETEYNDSRADIEYERGEYAKDQALQEMEAIIATGNMPSDKLIAKSGWSKATVEALVAQAKADLAKKATTGSSGQVIDTGSNPKKDPKPVDAYQEVLAYCEELAAKGDMWSAAACAKDALQKGAITQVQYNSLLEKYNPMLDAITSFRPPTEVKPK